MTDEKRSALARASAMIAAHAQHTGNMDVECACIDMISDVMLFAEEHGLNVDDVIDKATCHYENERGPS